MSDVHEIVLGDGLSLMLKPDGSWLRFRTSNKQEALVRLESLAERRPGTIICTAIKQWCCDRRTACEGATT